MQRPRLGFPVKINRSAGNFRRDIVWNNSQGAIENGGLL